MVGTLSGCASPADQSPAERAAPIEPVTELADVPGSFSPTSDGEVLRFGKPAEIVVTDFDTGTPVYLEVTVNPPERLTPAEVEDNIGQDPGEIGLSEPEEGEDPPEPERYRGFTCFVATFTPVGLPSDNVTVSLPDLRVIDPGGLNANYVQSDDNTYCGIDPKDELPANTGDMQEGREYKQAVVTWEGARDPGIVGTGVELSTKLSPANQAQPTQVVRWQ